MANVKTVSNWRRVSVSTDCNIRADGWDVILICDDSRMARKQILRALPAEFAEEVIQAEDGQAALCVLRSHPVSLLLLDLTMPVLDGFGVLQALQKEGLALPVIVVSADVQPEAQQRARSLGALGFIRKPVQATELHGLLARCGLL